MNCTQDGEVWAVKAKKHFTVLEECFKIVPGITPAPKSLSKHSGE